MTQDSSTTRIEIRRSSPSAPEAVALIRRHLAQMSAQSPEESCHAMDGSSLEEADVQFFLAHRDGTAIGMGALKRLDATTRELKSMHTVAEARGSGAGRAMLTHLLQLARDEGARDVYLETGSTEDFIASRSLYASLGFKPCAAFGNYAPDPWSVFMHLDMSQTA